MHTSTHAFRWLPVALLTLLTLLLPLTACGDDDSAEPVGTPTEAATPTAEPSREPTAGPAETPTPEPTEAPETPTPEPTAEPTAAPTPQPVARTVNVYWGMTIATAPAGSPERIVAGGRALETASPATAALEAVLDGPDALEAELGMFSSIPAGTELLGLTIRDGTAIVDLSGAFETSDGSLAETFRVGQVVFTLTQFDTVDAVDFHIDGVDVDVLGSHGLDATAPLDRDDFENIRALIMVEYPYPGGSFGPDDVIRGESNTFEASVEYTIADWDGLILDEGFTTATGGMGTWGTFTIEPDLPADAAGRGSVIVFETSARDGSQQNVIEYPVELTASG